MPSPKPALANLALAAEGVELRGDRRQRVSSHLPGHAVKVRTVKP